MTRYAFGCCQLTWGNCIPRSGDLGDVARVAASQAVTGTKTSVMIQNQKGCGSITRLVRLRLRHILMDNRDALAIKNHLLPGSSLDSLTERSLATAALNDLLMRAVVRLHSILGDRGRGGSPEKSSDGVVPYASSHLPEAESEALVPAGHTGTLKQPETRVELSRILR